MCVGITQIATLKEAKLAMKQKDMYFWIFLDDVPITTGGGSAMFDCQRPSHVEPSFENSKLQLCAETTLKETWFPRFPRDPMRGVKISIYLNYLCSKKKAPAAGAGYWVLVFLR